MAHTPQKKQPIETIPEVAQMVYFVSKDFKSGILNVFKQLKETVPRELKENMTAMCCQTGNKDRDRNNDVKENKNV